MPFCLLSSDFSQLSSPFLRAVTREKEEKTSFHSLIIEIRRSIPSFSSSSPIPGPYDF